MGWPVPETSGLPAALQHTIAANQVTTGRGRLPGLVRARVLKLAAGLDLTVKEKPLKPADLLAAGEAFLTSSLMEILPLTSVNGSPIGNGRPGPVTALLQARYREEKFRKHSC